MTEENTTVTTFEDAKKCPKCGQPGEDRAASPAPNLPRGTTIHHIYCVKELCPWYDTVWYVQVNPDGSIPPPRNHTGERKHYHGFEGHDDAAQRLVDAVRRQQQMETQEHTEIRNPNG